MLCGESLQQRLSLRSLTTVRITQSYRLSWSHTSNQRQAGFPSTSLSVACCFWGSRKSLKASSSTISEDVIHYKISKERLLSWRSSGRKCTSFDRQLSVPSGLCHLKHRTIVPRWTRVAECFEYCAQRDCNWSDHPGSQMEVHLDHEETCSTQDLPRSLDSGSHSLSNTGESWMVLQLVWQVEKCIYLSWVSLTKMGQGRAPYYRKLVSRTLHRFQTRLYRS